jgi:hypothetical protein
LQAHGAVTSDHDAVPQGVCALPAAQKTQAEQGAQVALIIYDQDLRYVADSYG